MGYIIHVISVLYFIETTVKAEARFCSFEGKKGDLKYYICPRNEYCCKLGCCLSPTFQFYQLWYYWLMVILMLLVCSGGQWWYRYWVQGGADSNRPPPARVAYHPARDTVTLVQHILKPNYPGGSRSSPPPTYSQMQLQECSSSGRPKPSPYNQIYGPPPSYDSVVAQSNGIAGVHIAGRAAHESSLSASPLPSPQDPPQPTPTRPHNS